MRCDHCGAQVPEGVFCTNCGAHQGTPGHGHPRHRHHRFAAHPGEHVFHPAIFTTLFPHLGHRKVHEFRWVFLGGVAGIFALFLAGLITAALCVAALLLPLLYLLYLYEAQVYRTEPARTLAVLVAGGVGLGVGVTIGTDRLVGSGRFALTITGSTLVMIGVVVPLIQEGVKPLPALVLRTRAAFPETMDGLVFGIAAGLGFGVGETFVRFSNVLTDLPVRSTPGSWIYPLITTAVFLPLMQGSAAGLVAAGVWRLGRGRVDAAAAGILLAPAAHIAFSLVTQLLANHGWSQLVILGWQALVVAGLLVAIRVVLHDALLEEAAELGEAERYCPHCHDRVLAQGFCPSCGLALTAVPQYLRPATA
jgi:RsiW-degrading membrane proteinase PrsW (M82 family)